MTQLDYHSIDFLNPRHANNFAFVELNIRQKLYLPKLEKSRP